MAVASTNSVATSSNSTNIPDFTKDQDIAAYRDMLTIIRDRVKAMIDKGMTAAQVRAAKPSLEYDGLYGKDRDWTGDMFLDAVYNSLKK